jgi:hypothetical protein
MLSRRAFVRHGVTGSVTALIGVAPLIARATATDQAPATAREASPTSSPDAIGASNSDHPKLHLAIFDHRFAAGRQFASSSEARGIATRPIANDVTSLWYSELHPLWKQQPVATAGLTTYGALFCLERLAWDHGMRVLHREQCDPRVAAAGEPNQLLYSWIIAPRRKSSNLESVS